MSNFQSAKQKSCSNSSSLLMKPPPLLLRSCELTGSISHRSRCLPSINTLERNSLWEEEAVLEEAGCRTELNDGLRKYCLCKEGARCEGGCAACCLAEQGCRHSAAAEEQEQSPWVPPQGCGNARSGGNYAATKQILTHNCTGSTRCCRAKLQRERTCRTIHTEHAEKKLRSF